MGDIRRLPNWLKTQLSLLPFNLPMEAPRVEDLPVIYRDVALIFEKFRLYAELVLDADWIKTLPCIPLNEEIKNILHAQMASDEMRVLRRLSTMESVSAEIIVRLELARELERAALTILQGERRAQVTLGEILSGARFKYYLNGILVSVQCPNQHRGTTCGAPDSFDHLLRCYRQQNKLQKGLKSINFLLLMARRAIPPTLMPAKPIHVE